MQKNHRQKKGGKTNLADISKFKAIAKQKHNIEENMKYERCNTSSVVDLCYLRKCTSI